MLVARRLGFKYLLLVQTQPALEQAVIYPV